MVVDQTVPSSFTIVPVAVAPEIVALVAFDNVTAKVSSGSSAVSSVVDTVNVRSVSPAVKVSVPVPAVKSAPEVAVTPEAAQSTVTVSVLAADSATVKVRPWPSSAETSATLSRGSCGHSSPSLRRHTVAVEPTGKSVAGSCKAAGAFHTQPVALERDVLSSNGNSCP